MKKLAITFMVCAALPLLAETWKDVPLVDANCSAKIRGSPDQHARQCALSCTKSGFAGLTSDGSFLKFDEAGNAQALAALRATKKTDHLRWTGTGKRSAESIQVESITLD